MVQYHRYANPVSPKVTTSTVTAAIITLVLYVLDQIVGDLPAVVEGAVLVVVTAVATFVAGFQTTDPLRAVRSRQTDIG